MDLGLRSPRLDCFKRGEVACDVRLLAAAGMLAPRALDQIGPPALLIGDGDDEICRTAVATLAAIPKESAGDARLVDPEGGAAPAETEEGEEDQQSFTQKLALLGVADA